MNLSILGVALGMGLLGSTHCVTMCGGLTSTLCGPSVSSPRAGPLRRTLAFHASRVLTYALLGGLVAAAGAWPTAIAPVRFALRVLAALCLLTVGLHLAGLPSSVGLLESLGAPLWRRLAPAARRFVPLRTTTGAALAGALWAFVPCGLLYGALVLAASAGSFLDGTMTMLTFALGTLPALVGVAVFAHRIGRASPWVRRTAGTLVLALGLWNATGLAREALGPTPPSCHAR